MDKRANESGQYLQLATSTGHRITLSGQHVLLVRQGDALVSRSVGSRRNRNLANLCDGRDWALGAHANFVPLGVGSNEFNFSKRMYFVRSKEDF